jgi:hypothetical protein
MKHDELIGIFQKLTSVMKICDRVYQSWVELDWRISKNWEIMER